MNLTAENVHNVFINCLFKEGESQDIFVKAEGVITNVGFHPDRLKNNEGYIQDMLDCLPEAFRKDSGGGWSFLNMCNDKNDEQWADLHQTMDELVCLGLATGKMSYLLPRELWKALPGGMPYLVINNG